MFGVSLSASEKLFSGILLPNWSNVIISVLLICLMRAILKLLSGLQAVNNLPGLRVPFQGLGFPGGAFPTSWWNPGLDFNWIRRFEIYKTYGREHFSLVPFLIGLPTIYVSNADVAKQVLGGNDACIKSDKANQFALRWGMNLFAAQGDTWRRHRRIMGPAFNNETFGFVWERTCVTYQEMLRCEGWVDKNVVDIPSMETHTSKLALLIVAACGFGFPFTWAEPPHKTGSAMSVQEALHLVSELVTFSLAAPRWMWYLPFEFFKKIRVSHETLYDFLESQALTRKERVREEMEMGDEDSQSKDVFSLLVLSNEAESGKMKMDKGELIGNMYVMLLAGHETTAHALAATMLCLALDDSVQDEIYENVISVVGSDQRKPTFQDFHKLDKVQAAFYEGIRMIPPASVLLREAAEDTVLIVPKPTGQEGVEQLPVRKGTNIVVDLIGIHYNPRYFSEPEQFKPSRWYKSLASEEGDSVFAFGIGSRACIGRKFATTEAVAFLCMVLRDWKLEPLMREGETKSAFKERVINPKLAITLSVKNVPVRLRSRK